MENQIIQKTHKGTTYFASSIEEIEEMINKNEYERSIFYRSSVYTYSCHARLLQDNSVEFIQFYNNGANHTVTNFPSKQCFWSAKK